MLWWLWVLLAQYGDPDPTDTSWKVGSVLPTGAVWRWPHHFCLVLLLALCGDIHPHPGPPRLPLTLVSANVTSLRAHQAEVMSWTADIVALQEVRLTSQGQRATAAVAREQGWTAIWGTPQPMRTGSIWGASPGGVGLLVRAPWQARRPELRPDDNVASALWKSGRWLHVVLALGTGTTFVNVQVVYGIPGQAHLNSEFLQNVMEYTARLGNAPSILAGDWNIHLDRQTTVPTSLSESLKSGRLVDMDLIHSRLQGTPPCAMCRKASGSVTRIDTVFADRRTAAGLQSVCAVPDATLPDHIAVQYVLDLHIPRQTVSKLRRLADPKLLELLPDQVLATANDTAAPHLSAFSSALAADNVEQAWQIWTRVAEATLLALSHPPDKPESGRGTSKMMVTTTMQPRRRTTQGAPKSMPIRHGTAALASLRTVQSHQRHYNCPGTWPTTMLQAWNAAAHHLRQAQALAPGLEWPLLPNAPSLDCITAVVAALRELVQKLVRVEEANRVAAWKSWMADCWSHAPRQVFSWIKQKEWGQVSLLQRPDGTHTGNIKEMDGMLHAAWDPIMRRFAERPEPDPALFMQHYGHLLNHHPMAVRPLTGQRLHAQLQRTSAHKATGPDGWSVGAMRRLPIPTLELLAELLNAVERTGCWPAMLAAGYVSLIPKGEGMQATNMRPLSVLPVIYRLWASLRLQEVMVWQETWLHPQAFGFRTGRSATDGYSLVAAMVELAQLRGDQLHIVGLDYVKCFDRVPQGLVLDLAHRLGLHSSVLHAMRAMYGQLQRRFKVNGCLGAAFAATNGILQGCPISVSLVNMLTTVWKRLLTQQATVGFPVTDSTYVRVVGYADDTYIIAPTADSVQQGANLTSDWLSVTEQEVNSKKSLHAVVGDSTQAVTISGAVIPRQPTFRILGAAVHVVATPGTSPLLLQRIEQGLQLVSRLSTLPFAFDWKANLLAALVTPTALFGVDVGQVLLKDLRRLEAASLRALWGPHRPARAPEAVFGILTQGHRTSAVLHVLYQRALWLARGARDAADFGTVIHAIWAASPHHSAGPMGRALKSLKQLGWVPLDGWWRWRIGDTEQLDLRVAPVGEVQHTVRASLHLLLMRRLKARRPLTFDGAEAGINGTATRAWLQQQQPELDRGCLRGLLTGATWTATRVHARGLRASADCPYCAQGIAEDEIHLVWCCRAWAIVRRPLLLSVQHSAMAIGLSRSPAQWPLCLRCCGLVPLTLGDSAAVTKFAVHLHTLMAAVLVKRMQTEQAQPCLFEPCTVRPARSHAAYPWEHLGAAVPSAAVQCQFAVPCMPASAWAWDTTFLADLAGWLHALQWLPDAGTVTFLELTLDFEAHTGRLVPVCSALRFVATQQPLQERSRVLRLAMVVLRDHLPTSSPPFIGAIRAHTPSLVPLGCPATVGLTSRAVFAAPVALRQQLLQLQQYAQRRQAHQPRRASVPPPPAAHPVESPPALPHSAQPVVDPTANRPPPKRQPSRGGSAATFATDYFPKTRNRQQRQQVVPRPPRAAQRPPLTLCTKHGHPVCTMCAAVKRSARLCCERGHHRCRAHELLACGSCMSQHRTHQHCCSLGHHIPQPPLEDSTPLAKRHCPSASAPVPAPHKRLRTASVTPAKRQRRAHFAQSCAGGGVVGPAAAGGTTTPTTIIWAAADGGGAGCVEIDPEAIFPSLLSPPVAGAVAASARCRSTSRATWLASCPPPPLPPTRKAGNAAAASAPTTSSAALSPVVPGGVGGAVVVPAANTAEAKPTATFSFSPPPAGGVAVHPDPAAAASSPPCTRRRMRSRSSWPPPPPPPPQRPEPQPPPVCTRAGRQDSALRRVP